MRWLVRLYPRRWRDRYGVELAELLDQCPRTLRTVSDLLRGAAVAHLQAIRDERRIAMARMRRLFGTAWLVGVVAAALVLYGAIGTWLALHRFDNWQTNYPWTTYWHTWRGLAVGAVGVVGVFALTSLLMRRWFDIRLEIARRSPSA
jgi:hypothetical protein